MVFHALDLLYSQNFLPAFSVFATHYRLKRDFGSDSIKDVFK